MSIKLYLLLIFCFFLFYSVVYKLAKKKKPLKRAFLTILGGIVILLLIDVSSVFTGIYLPISPLSLAVSGCMGVPGVATMLIIGWVL